MRMPDARALDRPIAATRRWRMRRCAHAPGPILAGLFFVALTLRPQIVGVGPLLPEIQDDLDTTHALVGLLATIPVLCMGLFAPAAAYLSARIGTRAVIT